tara:strand:+ start:555 stop:965 length:411 start_codon:yes stop_codon:yes gene_type:complete
MASILKVDELQGIATTGDITVTSEGGAVTQSLQQGLAKAWALWNGQSATPAFADSFNCSSLVDSGTGIYNPQLTNAMSASNFVSATSAHAAGVAWTAAVYVGGRTTNQMHYQTVYSSNQTAVDSNPCDIVSFGDLA